MTSRELNHVLQRVRRWVKTDAARQAWREARKQLGTSVAQEENARRLAREILYEPVTL